MAKALRENLFKRKAQQRERQLQEPRVNCESEQLKKNIDAVE